MFGRFIGNYSFSHLIYFFVSPNRENLEKEIISFLPKKDRHYFFSLAREAMYVALKDIKAKTTKKSIAIPGWGCPIVLAAVDAAGFNPVLVDIDPVSLKMNKKQVGEITDLAGVILIAENGIPYTNQEIKDYQKLNISVVHDYAIAWQNMNNYDVADYIVVSGGFSKPVSGLGFGALSTNNNIDVPVLKENNNSFVADSIKVFAHLLFQIPIMYKLLSRIVPKDHQAHYKGSLHKPSQRSLAIVWDSLLLRKKSKQKWLKLQKQIRDIFKIDSLHIPDNVMINKVLLDYDQQKNVTDIEVHTQYPYNLLDDLRASTLESGYPGITKIRENFRSITINQLAAENINNFLKQLQHSI